MISVFKISVFKQAALILAASTLVACAGSSGQQSTAEQNASEQVAPVVANADGATETPVLYTNEDRRVCKRFAPSGTRISKTVCKKQSEWDALSRNASEAGAEAQRRATHANATR